MDVGTGSVESRFLPNARSSTQPELVAIRLAAEKGAKAVYSDSLAALTTLKGWSGWKVARRLKCEDRAEVRAILWKAAEGSLQLLEKVKAHRNDAAAKADPRLCGMRKRMKERGERRPVGLQRLFVRSWRSSGMWFRSGMGMVGGCVWSARKWRRAGGKSRGRLLWLEGQRHWEGCSQQESRSGGGFRTRCSEDFL